MIDITLDIEFADSSVHSSVKSNVQNATEGITIMEIDRSNRRHIDFQIVSLVVASCSLTTGIIGLCLRFVDKKKGKLEGKEIESIIKDMELRMDKRLPTETSLELINELLKLNVSEELEFDLQLENENYQIEIDNFPEMKTIVFKKPNNNNIIQ